MKLYAWTNSTYNATFWTDVENPTTQNPLKMYDSNGNDITNTYTHGEAFISTTTSTSITYQYGLGDSIPIGVTPN